MVLWPAFVQKTDGVRAGGIVVVVVVVGRKKQQTGKRESELRESGDTATMTCLLCPSKCCLERCLQICFGISFETVDGAF